MNWNCLICKIPKEKHHGMVHDFLEDPYIKINEFREKMKKLPADGSYCKSCGILKEKHWMVNCYFEPYVGDLHDV